MKKFLFLTNLLLLLSFTKAQTRISLYEVFAGENSVQSLMSNPASNNLLAQPSNTPLVIPIKWQISIPSAPTTSWSLYQSNYQENDSRKFYYNITNVNTGRLDGQNPMAFGAMSDDISNLTGTTIATSSSYTTPFSITMNTSWDASYSNAVLTVTIQSSQSFTANGTLLFRLALVERDINFVSSPGSNSEKNFKDVVRKCYPTLWNGTFTYQSWYAGLSDVLTLSCTIPTSIIDKSQMAFVGFIQEEGTKKVWQAKRTNMVGAIPNDAKLSAITIPSFSCTNAFNPTITVFNQGSNSINAMTITPTIDGVAQAPYSWSGPLASLSSITIALGSYTASAGSHSVDINISTVSGGDVNTVNNKLSKEATLIQTYFTGPINQSFPTTSNFPPANWFVVNPDLDATWIKAGAGCNGSGSAKCSWHGNLTSGLIDEFYLPPSNLTGSNAPMLSFDVAYAQYISNNDKLEVKVSTDCGSNWITIYNKAGFVLETSPPQFSIFTPTSNNQWRNEIITLPASAANNPNVLVKFVATSDLGNNLYIDNVNLTNNITGIHTNNADFSNLQLYPNPSMDYVNIEVSIKNSLKSTISIYNSIGQVVIEKNIELTQGYNSIPLDLTSLGNGVYTAFFNSSDLKIIKKLVVSK